MYRPVQQQPDEKDDDEESVGNEEEDRMAGLWLWNIGRRRAMISIFLGFVVAILSAAVTAALVVTVITHTPSSTTPPLSSSSWSSCGTSPATARQRGCSFDIISFAWQMPRCYDAPLVDEFASWNGTDAWEFYTEVGGGRGGSNATVSKEKVMGGEIDAWVSWRFHKVHCTFALRQMHRAYERGWIDSHLRSFNHTLHCQMVLLKDDIGPDEVITLGRVIYPDCEPVGSSSSK